ncbi:hypothetical protein NP493_920g00005 [Ridgeia piscesae]|uniref:Acetoacetyl-CoA synthetase n=1 Tax=Ridgeia piscesae TaxID=27915 RepID=A0AAD9KKP8_RIDPI|nr:hypothetical protein NP493_920g00005 [Ridgeia piscesae]
MDTPVKCMWRPDRSKRTKQDDFRKRINNKFGVKLETYDDLYKWSLNNYPEFWETLWQFSELKVSQQYEEVTDSTKGIADIPEWFRGSRFNYAENLLRQEDNKIAIYSTGEGLKDVETRTFGELRCDVARLSAVMRKAGIKKGDRVVGYIPNCLEAVEAMLATASIGAVWSTTSPDFGVTGVLDRFSQIQPKMIFSVDGVMYNGKCHDHLVKLQQVVECLPDLETVVIVPYVTTDTRQCDISHIRNSCFLKDFLASDGAGDVTPELTFEQLPFNHPLYIMYSSGTTDVPKCMVHSSGGTLLKHIEEHVLQGNMTQNDILFYYTSTGWMMWNWMVSALFMGAAIVCYDGSPFVPNENVLWDLVDKIGVTVLGTGAKWLSVLDDRGIKPGKTHSLQTLHTILSTGSPLKPTTFDYVYRDIKSDLLLGSITGGTDIIACFAGHNCTGEVYRGEIQCRVLGMAVECWNEDGKPVLGDVGELVCTKPFPSMPTHFWNDNGGIKYKKAYFSHWPGVWAHGDFCKINPDTGGIWMLGRSDGTLNPNGVRFGSAEIYHIVEQFKEIQDSLCVSQRNKTGDEERVILFLQMAPGIAFSNEIVRTVKSSIRQQLSARHIPAIVLPTNEIPYTHNGKKVEVAVKKVISGEEVKVRGAYANPNCIDLYANIPELQGY